MLSNIRGLVYKMGFRPKPGTVLYSPSRDLLCAAVEGMKNVDWTKLLVLDWNGAEVIFVNSCLVCGKTDDEKPMCFRGMKWCCELHRKMVAPREVRRSY